MVGVTDAELSPQTTETRNWKLVSGGNSAQTSLIPPRKTPERKRTSAQAHLRLSLLLRKQPISELGGDQWKARMRGPASLNAPRRKEVDSVESGVGEIPPESEGFLSEAEGRVSDPRHQRREPTKGKLWSTVGGPAGSVQSCSSRGPAAIAWNLNQHLFGQVRDV